MAYFKKLYILQLKRIISKPSTLVCIILMPVLIAAFGIAYNLKPANSDEIKVAFYLGENYGAGQKIVDNLQQSDTMMFSIEKVNSAEDVENGVLAGMFDFGYVFSDDFEEKIEKNDYRRLVNIIKTPESTTLPIFNESLTNAIFQYIYKDIALKELEKTGIEEEMVQGFKNEFKGGMLTEVEISAVKNGNPEKVDLLELSLGNALKGLSAVFMFFFSLIFAVFHIKDIKTGFFRQQQVYRGTVLVAMPTALAQATAIGIAGVLALVLSSLFFQSGNTAPVYIEILSIVFYLLYLSAIIYFLSAFLPYVNIIISFIPIILALCFVFCPILIDVGNLSTFFAKIQNIFPPTLYLRGINNNFNALAAMFAASIMLFLLGAIKQKSQKHTIKS